MVGWAVGRLVWAVVVGLFRYSLVLKEIVNGLIGGHEWLEAELVEEMVK